jgi:membrane-bound lytic murein transglycosylase B
MKRTLLALSCALFTPLMAQAETYEQFIDGVRTELASKKMDVAIFNKAMEGHKEPNVKVYKKLKKQPETTYTFMGYYNRLVSSVRVSNGQKNLAKHRADLERISTQYNFPVETMLALWGIESAYGTHQGNFAIIPSLSDLAFKSHRKEFFRSELIKAVGIVQDGHIELENLKGSWAGAMGQCQFMPSSFYTFAADGNADGRKDIWNTEADVFASTANYITNSGWLRNKNWGEAITLTKILPKIKLSENGLSGKKTMAEWYAMGIQHKDARLKKKFSEPTRVARLFMPQGPAQRTYLVYENFDVIMKWNRSSYFAFSVLSLADRIVGREAL